MSVTHSWSGSKRAKVAVDQVHWGVCGAVRRLGVRFPLRTCVVKLVRQHRWGWL